MDLLDCQENLGKWEIRYIHVSTLISVVHEFDSSCLQGNRGEKGFEGDSGSTGEMGMKVHCRECKTV